MERRENTLKDFLPRQERQEREAEEMLPTLAEMAGADGQPVIREGKSFYPRSPKLRSLDTIVETLERVQKADLKRGEAVMTLATLFLVVDKDDCKNNCKDDCKNNCKDRDSYRDEDGNSRTPGHRHDGRRPATEDEVADCFDLGDVDLLARLARKYLHLRPTSLEPGERTAGENEPPKG